MFEYISTKETAKLVRGALKAKFPGVKFSVRGSGGSLDIRWIDGPTSRQVKAVVGPFEGGGFDGMIDMEYSASAYILADGTVVEGNSSGTAGSGGSVTGYTNEKPEGAREVHFGTKYIFEKRGYTEDFIKRAIAAFGHRWGQAEASKISTYIASYDGSAHYTCKDRDTEYQFRAFIERRVIAR